MPAQIAVVKNKLTQLSALPNINMDFPGEYGKKKGRDPRLMNPRANLTIETWSN
jgi:hypothetical protein